MSYGYNAGTANNGNIVSWVSSAAQAFSRSYGYDQLNRLQSMNDANTAQACRGLSWTYDAWGNRTDQNVTAGSCLASHITMNTQNKLAGPPYQYDAAGASLLLKKGAHINASDSGGYTALMQAADQCTDGKMVALLIRAGASVNAKKP